MDGTLQRPLEAQENFGWRQANLSSNVISFYLCAFVVLGLCLASERFIHWFVFPVTLCGVLIGKDAIDWFRGKLDVFDPVGILGLLGFHFFFLAPLLHVGWDYWMRYVVPPDDWRPWLGYMAVLNFFGLLLYNLTRSISWGSKSKEAPIWKANPKRLFFLIVVALVITGALQILVYINEGGILGYISSFAEERVGAFEGMGLIFTISESFPILAMFGFAVYAQKHNLKVTWSQILLSFAIFLVLVVLFGGLRGSRSNIIWALFWAAGIVHFQIKAIPKKIIYLGVIFLVVFMYFYGFYKNVGADAFKAFEGSAARTELEQQTGRTIQQAVLLDLARSDVQAFLLYRIEAVKDYEYAWGRTYLGAASILVPKSLWPDRPPTKIKEGTEALWGMGTYIPIVSQASNVYGIAGEAMLNFGFLAVPFAIGVLGLVVSKVRYWLFAWHPGDSRLFLLPLLVNFCFTVMVNDSEINLFFLIKYGFVPFLVIMMGSNRQSKPAY